MKPHPLYIIRWGVQLLILLLPDSKSQIVVSNMDYCDRACQAAQRAGLDAIYDALGGEIKSL